MLRLDDEQKNKSNRTKHGIWFEEAQGVFSDPHGRLFYDPEHSEHEERFILLGMSSATEVELRIKPPRKSFATLERVTERELEGARSARAEEFSGRLERAV